MYFVTYKKHPAASILPLCNQL